MTANREYQITKYKARIHSLQQRDPVTNANIIRKAQRKLRKLMAEND